MVKYYEFKYCISMTCPLLRSGVSGAMCAAKGVDGHWGVRGGRVMGQMWGGCCHFDKQVAVG